MIKVAYIERWRLGGTGDVIYRYKKQWWKTQWNKRKDWRILSPKDNDVHLGCAVPEPSNEYIAILNIGTSVNYSFFQHEEYK